MPVVRNRQQSVCACGDALVHYAPFGEFAAQGETLPRRMFTGYEYDAAWGMYNARKRLYAPNLRTFVSVDPKFQYASPYLYCMSDPFNSVDPTGEMSTGGIINAVINAGMIVASIIIAVLTWGAGTPAVVAADEGVVAGENAVVDIIGVGFRETYVDMQRQILRLRYVLAEENEAGVLRYKEGFHSAFAYRETLLGGRARRIEEAVAQQITPARRVAAVARKARMGLTMDNVAKTMAIGAVAGGPTTLAANAAAGENISSSEVIDNMLIQPAIALLGMGVGAGAGIAAGGAAAKAAGITFKQVAISFGGRLVSYTIGAAVGTAAAGTVSAAAHKEDLGSAKTWENIGVSVGVSVVVAAAFAGMKAPYAPKARIGAEQPAHAAAPPRLSLEEPYPEEPGGIIDPDANPVEFGEAL
jgi:RHS repeat-associated protein